MSFILPNATQGIGAVFVSLNMATTGLFALFLLTFPLILFFAFSRYSKMRGLAAGSFVAFIMSLPLWFAQLVSYAYPAFFVGLTIAFTWLSYKENN